MNRRLSTRKARTHRRTKLRDEGQNSKIRKQILNNQDNRHKRSLVSNPGLTAMMSPKRIMRNGTNLSFLTTYRQMKLRSEAVQKPEAILEDGLESIFECPTFKPTTRPAPAPSVIRSISDPFITSKLKDAMREMVD